MTTTSSSPGWKTLLGIVVSVLWLIAIYLLSSSEQYHLAVFLTVGAAPVALIWGLLWAIRRYLSGRTARVGFEGAWIRRSVGILLIWGSFLALDFFVEQAGYRGRAGHVLGYYVWMLPVAWIVWATAFKRIPGGMLLASGIAFAAAAGWESTKHYREYAEADNFTKRGSVLIARMNAGNIPTRDEISRANVGRLEPVLVTFADFSAESLKIRRRLEATMSEVGMENMLSAATLGTREGLGATEAKLGRLRAAVQDAETGIRKQRTQFSVQMKAIDLPDAFKRAFVQGVRNSPIADDAAFDEFFRIQHGLIEELAKLAAFLQSKQGGYLQKDGKLHFRNPRDSETYRSHMASILDLAKREANWQESMRQRTSAKLKGLSDTAK